MKKLTLLPPQQLFFLAITARLRHRKATPAGATSGLMMRCTIHVCLDFDQLGSNGLWGKLGCWYVPEQTELIRASSRKKFQSKMRRADAYLPVVSDVGSWVSRCMACSLLESARATEKLIELKGALR
ncbi:hypothetical protein [Xanthomonas euroxanthea]|uniref:hypothetical protein n=1 Tax=Xanthomonas euroxanthea TaxID=2259622 RepID=UPI0016151903|nr:hypothetical protein [Xanthomonas euroxanthea]